MPLNLFGFASDNWYITYRGMARPGAKGCDVKGVVYYTHSRIRFQVLATAL